MKLKNVKVGNLVEIKIDSAFDLKKGYFMIPSGSTGKVIRIDGTGVLVELKDVKGWFDSKELRKLKLKTLDQSVFESLGKKWKFAAVDGDGCAYGFMEKPELDEDDPCFVDGDVTRCKWIGENYETSDWKNSLIKYENPTSEGISETLAPN